MTPQVVVLAAGQSSRFFPFNQVHKSLISICGKPIIAHTLDSINQARLSQVIIVQNQDKTVETRIKKFIPQNLQVSFVEQPKPRGMGDALQKAASRITGSFFVINANEINFHQHSDSLIKRFTQEKAYITTLRQKTTTPQKFGIYQLDGDRVINLVEKPPVKDAPSNWRNIAIYLMQPDFLNLLEKIPTSDDHFEQTVSQAAKDNPVFAIPTNHPVPSIKYPWDLLQTKNIILDNLSQFQASDCQIANSAVLQGKVIIESGVQIHHHALIQGPVYLGKNSLVGSYCQIRNSSILEQNAQVERYCDVKNSIIGAHTHIHSEFIGDSIFGEQIRVGAGFITANKRIDRKDIRVSVKEKLIDSHTPSLGVFVGDHVQMGIRVSTMPGTVVGPHSVIYPSLTLQGTYPTNSQITSNLI